jgi:aminoglycoside phosphotransferase (APT) family kinase protein
MTWRHELETWLSLRFGAPVQLDPPHPLEGSGFSHSITTVRATCKGVTHELIIRASPRGQGLLQNYDLAREAALLSYVHESCGLAPAVRWLETDTSVLGSPFMVMDRLDGLIPSITPGFMQDPWLVDSSPAEQAAFWWAAIDGLAVVHALPQPAAVELPPLVESWAAYLDWLASHEPRPPETHLRLLQKAWRALLRRRPTAGRQVLLHGDFQPPNMLWDLEHIVMLDWEAASWGEPAFDVAVWLLADRYFSEGAGVRRLPGLPDAAATIERYEQQSGQRLRNLEWYQALALFKAAALRFRATAMLDAAGIMPAGFDVYADPCIRWFQVQIANLT